MKKIIVPLLLTLSGCVQEINPPLPTTDENGQTIVCHGSFFDTFPVDIDAVSFIGATDGKSTRSYSGQIAAGDEYDVNGELDIFEVNKEGHQTLFDGEGILLGKETSYGDGVSYEFNLGSYWCTNGSFVGSSQLTTRTIVFLGQLSEDGNRLDLWVGEGYYIEGWSTEEHRQNFPTVLEGFLNKAPR